MHLKEIIFKCSSYKTPVWKSRAQAGKDKTACKISRLPSISGDRNILYFNKELSVGQNAEMQNNKSNTDNTDPALSGHGRQPTGWQSLPENWAAGMGQAKQRPPSWPGQGGSLHSPTQQLEVSRDVQLYLQGSSTWLLKPVGFTGRSLHRVLLSLQAGPSWVSLQWQHRHALHWEEWTGSLLEGK